MCTQGVGELTENLLQMYMEDNSGVSFRGRVQTWDSESDVKVVVQKVKECKKLLFLELEGNTLGVDAAKAIGKALESKTELEAALWKDLFTGRLKNEIPQAMNFLLGGIDLAGARLQYLDLSDNAIGPLGMIGLAPFFRCTSSFSLKVLICNNNGLGPQGAEQFSKALIDCRELSLTKGGEVFNLKKLVCGRNRMQNTGAIAIANFLKECGSLEEIHIHENSIYWQAQTDLAEAFLANPNLRLINLNDNTIVGKGLRMLSETFSKLNNLEELNLGDCLLKTAGALHVVKAVKDLPKLQRLVLEGNEISKAGGIEISRILRSNRSLRSINFNSNGFGVQGAEIIGELLRHLQLDMFDTYETDNEEDGNEELEEDDDKEVSEDEESNEDDEDDNEAEDEDEVEDEEDESYDGTEYDDDPCIKAIKFYNEPTVENYPARFLEYLYDITSEEQEAYAMCIESALQMVQLYSSKSEIPELCTSIFGELMTEAARYAVAMPNEFSTSLLINMGLFRGEHSFYQRDQICNRLLGLLHDWLVFLPEDDDICVPESVLACLATAFENARPNLIVDRPKLSTLIPSVMMERESLAALAKLEVTGRSKPNQTFGF